MSNIKMILKNTIQLKRVYLTYFFSLILASTIYFSFICFVNSTMDFVVKDLHVEITTFLTALIYIVFICLSIFIILLMYIANKMLFSIRSQEYANYRIIGVNKQKIGYFIFIEQICIIGLASIVSYFASYLLTWSALSVFEGYIKKAISVDVNIVINLINPLFIIFIAILIGLVVSVIVIKMIYKMELIDLLKIKSNNENITSNKRFVIFKFGCVLIINLIYMLSFFEFSTRITSYEFIIYLSVYLVLLFITITTFGDALAKIVPKKYYYHKANSFKQSIITSSMSYNLFLISLTTILFTISLSLFTMSYFELASIRQSQIPGDLDSMKYSELVDFEYDGQKYSVLKDIIYSEDNQPILIGDDDFNQQTGLNIDLINNQAIKLQSDVNNNQNYTIVDTINANIDGFIVDQKNVVTDQQLKQEVAKAGGDLFIYKHLYNYQNSITSKNKSYNFYINFLSESQYEAYTNQTIDINSNYLYLLTNNSNLDNLSIDFYDTNQRIEATYPLKTLPMPNNNTPLMGENLYVIYDDTIQNDLLRLDESEYRTEYIINDNNFNYQTYRNIFPSQYYIHNSKKENADAFLQYILLFGSLIIISILILIIILTILGLKAISEGIFIKDNYQHLRWLNYPQKEINAIANQITAIYFFIPLIIGVFTSTYFMLVFFKYSLSFSMFSGAIFNIHFISSLQNLYFSLFIFYILYYLIVNYNYKKIIIIYD